jgi:hypothetical protein
MKLDKSKEMTKEVASAYGHCPYVIYDYYICLHTKNNDCICSPYLTYVIAFKFKHAKSPVQCFHHNTLIFFNSSG